MREGPLLILMRVDVDRAGDATRRLSVFGLTGKCDGGAAGLMYEEIDPIEQQLYKAIRAWGAPSQPRLHTRDLKWPGLPPPRQAWRLPEPRRAPGHRRDVALVRL